MQSRVLKTFILLGLSFSLAACNSMNNTQRNTAAGAVIGGAAGHLIGGDTGSTLGGAVLGGLIGSQIDN